MNIHQLKWNVVAFNMIFYTTLHSAFVDDNTAKYAKLDCILSSSHGTDIVMKDNYYFYFKSQPELCFAVFLRPLECTNCIVINRLQKDTSRHFFEDRLIAVIEKLVLTGQKSFVGAIKVLLHVCFRAFFCGQN